MSKCCCTPNYGYQQVGFQPSYGYPAGAGACGFGGNNIWWIIILLIFFCGNGFGGRNNNCC